MFIPPSRKSDKATDPATAMFRFWISFWPVAPLFGVKWRFGDVTMPMHGNLAANPMDLARAGAEVQERAAETAVSAPAVAEPVAEQAAETAEKAPTPARMEKAIERTIEPAGAPEDAPAEPDSEPEAEAPASRPKGLHTKAPASPDDLKLIKGIGPALERQLNGLGVYRFEQLAGFDDEALRWVDQNLETVTFKGRCFRDDWVGQAKAQLD